MKFYSKFTIAFLLIVNCALNLSIVEGQSILPEVAFTDTVSYISIPNDTTENNIKNLEIEVKKNVLKPLEVEVYIKNNSTATVDKDFKLLKPCSSD
ncbi:MAG: hypothetical protein U5K69_23060 [Balneolaceae bacterium]|nr:hypothetical protein [Balneolaceae bacterium]